MQIVKRLQSIRDCGPPPITLQLGVNAKRFRKAKTVFAYKTKDPITIKKDWGKNVGKAGCYVICSEKVVPDVAVLRLDFWF